MIKSKHVTNLEKIPHLSEDEKKVLKQVTEKFVFRINDYYLNLIDWSDPDDPIRKIVIPNVGELEEYGRWDASDEETNYVARGCQHKYKTTALLLVSEVPQISSIPGRRIRQVHGSGLSERGHLV